MTPECVHTYNVTTTEGKVVVVTTHSPVPEAEFLDEGTKEWTDAASYLARYMEPRELPADWESVR